jgi:hypothetical protein
LLVGLLDLPMGSLGSYKAAISFESIFFIFETHRVGPRDGLLLLVGLAARLLVEAVLARVGLQAVVLRSRPSTPRVTPPRQQDLLERIREERVERGAEADGLELAVCETK